MLFWGAYLVVQRAAILQSLNGHWSITTDCLKSTLPSDSLKRLGIGAM